MKAGFEQTCIAIHRQSDEVLAQLLNGKDAADFWDRVKTNLEAGRIRLLFIADRVPPELKRIVEFLNRQMNPAEVLAIELRQYADGNGQKTIVPVVYGQTQDALNRKGVAARGRQWDRASFVEAMSQNAETPEQLALAMRILEWMGKGGRKLLFGSGQSGMVAPDFGPQGIDFKPVYLGTNVRLFFQFGGWKGRSVFGELRDREDLVRRFGEINDSGFDENTPEKYPSLSLRRILRDPDGSSKLFAALNWMENRIAEHAQRNFGNG